tara:strand:+ start:3039 stop:3434 length:396 start_codon:yes stop_codon:yes gene_type:complete
MTKKTRIYARALVAALKDVEGKEMQARIARFKEVLKKRGDLKLVSAVIREFQRLWEQREGKISRVVVANPEAGGGLKKTKEMLQKKGYQSTQEVQEDLIGGLAVFLGSEYLIDNTIRGRLQKLQEYLTEKK